MGNQSVKLKLFTNREAGLKYYVILSAFHLVT